MGRQQQYNRAETIEKAMHLFRSRGFSGTSMRDLESRLDMRPGSIYASFGSKEGLYEATLDHYAATSLESLDQHMAQAENFLTGLRGFIEQILFPADGARNCMLVKTVSDLNPTTAALKEKAFRMLLEFEKAFIRELRRAQTTGEVSPTADIPTLARFIQVQIIGLRAYGEIQPSKTALNELLDSSLYAIKSKMTP